MDEWGVPGETPEEGEWPARDRVPFVREVEVTREMIAVGERIFNDRRGKPCRLAAIYRAMHAVAPVELITNAEEHLARENTRLHDALKIRTDGWNEAAAEIDRLREIIMGLYDLMTAQRPAPVPDTPKPTHDWTRVVSGDRRRIGG